MTTGYVNPDSVSLLEQIACAHPVDRHLVDPVGLEETWPAEAFSIASAEKELCHVVCLAVRINVRQLGDQVSVHGIRGGVEHHLNGPRDIDLLVQKVRCLH